MKLDSAEFDELRGNLENELSLTQPHRGSNPEWEYPIVRKGYAPADGIWEADLHHLLGVDFTIKTIYLPSWLWIYENAEERI
jgi:hypothetical protein